MRVGTIPSGVPFLAAFAKGILAKLGTAPESLSRATVLLPNRRAVRALGEAFLAEAGGKPLLLPRIAAIGDVDEDELILTGEGAALDAELPPAIDGVARELLLAKLVAKQGGQAAPSPAAALRLARALAELLDSLQIEEVPWANFDGLVPDDYARHWSQTLEFLAIIREHWPVILEARGQMDPQARRVKLIRALAQRWEANPPQGPIWAAGSTGSVPATAHLLKVIAGLPQGEVVLPGLDRDSDAATWEAIGEEPSHPQYGLHHLLRRMEVARDAVTVWDGAKAGPRAALAAEALRPAATTQAWRTAPKQDDAAFAGLMRLESADPDSEAGAIAVLLRGALESPGRTATLVTADRNLARRVSAKLRRWGIEADDSAGRRLDLAPATVLLRLLARAVADDLAPVELLALLKHPLASLGRDRTTHLTQTRRLDRLGLRGPRPAPGIAGLRKVAPQDALPLIDALDAALKPLATASENLRDLLAAHIRAAEDLARDETGRTRLWDGQAGNALANFAARLIDAAPDFGDVKRHGFADLLDELLATASWRPPYGGHPRISIRGTIEARLVSADLVVLGGLNETTWPGETREDPWLSRPMRAKVGLPPLERQIGLAAHDFAQAFSGASVVLSRARKTESGPAIASRWLVRLDALLGKDPRWAASLDPDPAAWAATLDGHGRVVAPIRPPAPKPPVAARPKGLSVTRIETLIRDPYAIYASKILGLYALDEIDADADARQRGNLYHDALERFAKTYPGEFPPDALAQLIAFGRDAFDKINPPPSVRAFWWPRFVLMAEMFVAEDAARRAKGMRVAAVETKGTLDIDGFALSATADRIDRKADGTLVVLDYKTGTMPTGPQVATGLSPQLPLEALIAEAGGFEGVAKASVAELTYIGLGGSAKDRGFQTRAPAKAIADMPTFLAETRANLAALIKAYRDPDAAYRSRPRVQYVEFAGDYDHLARVAEWAIEGGDE